MAEQGRVCVWPGERSVAPDACWSAACADTHLPLSFVCYRVRSSMFVRASSFNSDLSKWEVSGVTSMRCVCVARGEQRGARCELVCGLR